MAPLTYRYLGRARYEPVWRLQKVLCANLQAHRDGAREVLLAVEHEPVITLGRRGKPEDVLLSEHERRQRGIDLFQVERGGEVTYHGPGQLVLYPIVRVSPTRFGVGDLVRGLASAIADRLADSGVRAVYDADRPGLWVGAAKIAAVGMRVARGVSMHGAALNVDTDLTAFTSIVPCGMPDAPTTSLRRVLGETAHLPTLEALAADIARRFADRFDFELVTPSDAEWAAWRAARGST